MTRWLLAAALLLPSPGVSLDAAADLAKEFETHNLTMKLNLFHIKNAANLVALASGFTLVMPPIKIAGGGGGPTRVFALIK